MSNEQDIKKLSTSSGGGYRPLQKLEEQLSEARPETTRERGLRQRRERQAELKSTPEDYARWESNRNRALAANGPTDIYTSVENAAMYVGGITKTLGDAITTDIEAVIADPVSALQSINDSLRGVVDAVTYFPDALINEVAPEYSYGAQARVNAKINEVIDGAVGDLEQHAALLESGDYLGAGSIAGGYAAGVALPGKKVGLPSASSRYAELKDKYGHLSAEERRALLEQKIQLNNQRIEAKALVTGHPGAHSFERHGGSVTEPQLMTRAISGVAPDGSVKLNKKGQVVLPPMSSAFHSDELLLFADQKVRNSGILDKKIADATGNVVKVLPEDMGSLGTDLGQGFKRMTSSRYRPDYHGAVEKVENLDKVQAVYEKNQDTGIWETITIFPAE